MSLCVCVSMVHVLSQTVTSRIPNETTFMEKAIKKKTSWEKEKVSSLVTQLFYRDLFSCRKKN